ncbi:ImmA/IrrE family metallo-endopeptidase [Salinispora mooreana]|uniref:ImmA/IrrE family metallo-endopeptidase n=1 Tax=Salinispora mooreana TaxID=999545 RepID=UPI0004769BA9|nr:ImmA/IrrE family metallo-endopeptidase [Salinispora mooreana]
MRRARLSRRCRRLINELRIPVPFDLDKFRQGLAEQRGRSLNVTPLPVLAEPGFASGVWVATDATDYILYNDRTSPLHQRHIILHEVGHMIFRHNERRLSDHVLLDGGFPHLDPQSARHLMGRVHYSEPEEAEAEMAATLLLEAIGEVPGPSRFSGLLAEAEALLGFRKLTGARS